jgi:hypothetical protein
MPMLNASAADSTYRVDGLEDVKNLMSLVAMNGAVFGWFTNWCKIASVSYNPSRCAGSTGELNIGGFLKLYFDPICTVDIALERNKDPLFVVTSKIVSEFKAFGMFASLVTIVLE